MTIPAIISDKLEFQGVNSNMAHYEIIEHSVEGTGERHFFRVAVWHKEHTPSPDVYAEFLLHPGPEHDPMGNIVPIIEKRVEFLVDNQDVANDEFRQHELKQFNLRTANKLHPVEDHIARNIIGTRGEI